MAQRDILLLLDELTGEYLSSKTETNVPDTFNKEDLTAINPETLLLRGATAALYKTCEMLNENTEQLSENYGAETVDEIRHTAKNLFSGLA